MTVNQEWTMHCDEFAARLADFLERDAGDAEREAMESHALACAACGALLADLRAIAAQAATLPELTPSRDLWDDIAARIDAPVIPLNTGEWKGTTASGSATRRRALLRVSAMAASLIAAAALGAFATYQFMSRTTPDASSRTAAAPNTGVPGMQPATRVASGIDAAGPESTSGSGAVSADRLGSSASGQPASTTSRPSSPAEATYANEIGRLEAVVRQRRAQLDPVTVTVIDRNLRVIDEAIAQCREALARDPASAFLMESLNHALENKVRLLRTTAMLPARS